MDKNGERWIGIDLDGTLAMAADGWPEPDQIGEPIPTIMDALKNTMAQGRKIKIFTARAGWEESMPHVEAWLKKHGLGGLEVTNVKDMYCDLIIDDKAVGVIRNHGLLIGLHSAGVFGG